MKVILQGEQQPSYVLLFNRRPSSSGCQYVHPAKHEVRFTNRA